MGAEAISPLLDKRMEGFGELFRVLSFESIGTSTLQSRCLAGVANGTFVFVLPGSLDAVTTAWDRLIAAQLSPEMTLQPGADPDAPERIIRPSSLISLKGIGIVTAAGSGAQALICSFTTSPTTTMDGDANCSWRTRSAICDSMATRQRCPATVPC